MLFLLLIIWFVGKRVYDEFFVDDLEDFVGGGYCFSFYF